jgi:putative oxygen-independent coproporphyrinogen III oxidase
MSVPVGVYLSVPFCRAKCTFCNFASDAFAADRMQGYVDRLCEEIQGARRSAEKMEIQLSDNLDSIYFGGGTPSLLSPKQFEQIFRALRNQFTLPHAPEITLECAPGQLAEDTLEELLRQGMSRISFGIQSFVDKETSSVGRLHTRQQCESELERVRIAGLSEINLDLIAGLPHQTERSWIHSVEQAVASGVPHISVYMLEVDEDSRLGKEMLANGTRYHAQDVPSEDETATWYEIACEMLNAAGIQQYEISNFASEGHQSSHNLKYWLRKPYIGFGLDAHSMLPGANGAVRFANTDDLEMYLGGSGSSEPLSILRQRAIQTQSEILGREEEFEESLFLGLRLNKGVDLTALRVEFGEAMLNHLIPSLTEIRDAGLLKLESNRISLTASGRMASNEVFSRLLVSAA